MYISCSDPSVSVYFDHWRSTCRFPLSSSLDPSIAAYPDYLCSYGFTLNALETVISFQTELKYVYLKLWTTVNWF